MKLILASASPRRAEILRDAGIPFEALPARADESKRDGEAPVALVRRLAETKARAAAEQSSRTLFDEPRIVVGADTEVVIDGAVLGKPRSADDARAMLRLLSGRTHEVITGLAVLRVPRGATQAEAARVEEETTRVTFAALEDAEIAAYVASGEPFDKAGAYAIQGRAGRYVTRIEGCYFNVVGLPLARLWRILRDLGWPETAK
jgi:septum formation protein